MTKEPVSKGRREWIKLYMSDWLDDGFTSFLTPAQLGVAAKLWALAGRMKVQGIICKKPGNPYTLAELSQRLHFKPNLVNTTLGKLEDYGFTLTDPNGIHWVHWNTDQPDYGDVDTRRLLPPDKQKNHHQADNAHYEDTEPEDDIHIPSTPEEIAKANAAKKRLSDALKALPPIKKL